MGRTAFALSWILRCAAQLIVACSNTVYRLRLSWSRSVSLPAPPRKHPEIELIALTTRVTTRVLSVSCQSPRIITFQRRRVSAFAEGTTRTAESRLHLQLASRRRNRLLVLHPHNNGIVCCLTRSALSLLKSERKECHFVGQSRSCTSTLGFVCMS